jgi:hypothetical protein
MSKRNLENGSPAIYDTYKGDTRIVPVCATSTYLGNHMHANLPRALKTRYKHDKARAVHEIVCALIQKDFRQKDYQFNV